MRWIQRSVWAVAAGVSLAAVAGAEPANKPANKVEVVVAQAYVTGADADAQRHQLDLYVPAGQKDYPVVVFFHGGGFTKGDRKDVAEFGQALASRGIGVAAASYRLAPNSKHPSQIQDAARAVAWVKQNIAKHGGKAEQIFVGGHSAGGHLAALLATDEQYLKAVGVARADIRGVVSLSGAYVVPEARQDVFGDEAARKQASPLTHVQAGLPPFFLAHADADSPGRDQQTRDFAAALQAKQVTVELFVGKERDHGSLFKKITADDPTGQAVIQFVQRTAQAVAAPAKK